MMDTAYRAIRLLEERAAELDQRAAVETGRISGLHDEITRCEEARGALLDEVSELRCSISMLMRIGNT